MFRFIKQAIHDLRSPDTKENIQAAYRRSYCQGQYGDAYEEGMENRDYMVRKFERMERLDAAKQELKQAKRAGTKQVVAALEAEIAKLERTLNAR